MAKSTTKNLNPQQYIRPLIEIATQKGEFNKEKHILNLGEDFNPKDYWDLLRKQNPGVEINENSRKQTAQRYVRMVKVLRSTFNTEAVRAIEDEKISGSNALKNFAEDTISGDKLCPMCEISPWDDDDLYTALMSADCLETEAYADLDESAVGSTGSRGNRNDFSGASLHGLL